MAQTPFICLCETIFKLREEDIMRTVAMVFIMATALSGGFLMVKLALQFIPLTGKIASFLSLLRV